jgi:heme oxygenase
MSSPHQPSQRPHHQSTHNQPAQSPSDPATPSSAEVPLSAALKQETADAHHKAERHSLQARLIRGMMSPAEVAAYLSQLLAVWEAIDAGMAAKARADRRVSAMWQEYHPHAGRTAESVRALAGREMGAGAGVTAPVPATARLVEFVRACAAASDARLVGVWYVLEGSANGGQYIAKALAGAMPGMAPGTFVAFDPHGAEQRPRWQRWREGVDAAGFGADERREIVKAAEETFEGMWRIMEDLSAGMPPILPIVPRASSGSDGPAGGPAGGRASARG